MSVETGPSEAVAGTAIGWMARVSSVGGVVIYAGPAFEGAPSLGNGALAKGFGPKFESVSYIPIDSPIGKGEVKNMKLYKVGMFAPTGTVVFNSHPRELNQDKIADAVLKVEPTPKGFALPAQDLIQIQRMKRALEQAELLDLSKNVAKPIEPSATVGFSPKVRSAPAVGLKLKPIEKIKAETVELVIEKVEEKLPISKQTEEIRYKKRYLVDKIVLSRRVLGVKEAVKKAAEIAKKFGILKISGRLINKFWLVENPDYLSPVVRPEGPDGSIPEIKEEIEGREFISEEEAKQGAVTIVESKRPVKEGESDRGDPAKQEEVSRVFKFRLFKPPALYKEVVKRVTKKVYPPSTQPDPVISEEPHLEDYPDLSAVFPKGFLASCPILTNNY